MNEPLLVVHNVPSCTTVINKIHDLRPDLSDVRAIDTTVILLINDRPVDSVELLDGLVRPLILIHQIFVWVITVYETLDNVMIK